MRWFIRVGIIGLCLLLWTGLWCGASAIAMGAAVPARKPFCFPEFLPGADMYAWSLTPNTQCDTVLLVQNIGKHNLDEVVIIFWADGKELCFEAECIPPGQKVFIAEKHNTPFADWHTVSYMSYTAKEIAITSLAYKEDFSCK